MKEIKAVVLGSVNKTLLAGVLAVAPVLSTLVADTVAPGQTYIQSNVAHAQVKAGNKQFETRRLPGVSQDFAKDLAEVSNFLQPEEGSGLQANPDKALEVLNRVARRLDKLNPYETAQLYLYTAYSYYAKEDLPRTRQNFEKVLAQSPNIPLTLEASTMKTLATLYGQEENYKKALELMLRWTDYVSEIRPEDHYLFGSLYYQQGDLNNALLNVNEAVRVQEATGRIPPESWYGMQRGLHIEREDFKSGVAVVEKLVRHYPKASYWRQLSQFYAQLERNADKLSALEATYLQGGLTTERDLIVLAQYFLEAEVPYKAAKVLDRGINKDKIIEPTAKNLELLANSWRAAAEYDKSLIEMEKAAQKSENGDLLHTLATLYNANDRYKDAVRVGRQALTKGGLRRPDQVHLAIGSAHMELGEFDAAIKAFNEAAKDSRSKSIADQWAKFAASEKKRIEAASS